MLTIRSRRVGILFFLLAITLVCLPCSAQPTVRAPSVGQAEPASVERVTTEMVDAQIKQVEQSTEIDEATKKQLAELLAKAKATLQVAENAQQQAAKFTSWIKTAEADKREAESYKQNPPKIYDFAATESESLADLTNDLAELERQREVAKQELEAAKNEPQRRTQRTQPIAEEIAAARKTLEETTSQLKPVEPSESLPVVLQARKMNLLANRQAALATIAAREAERQAYDAQGNLPRQQIDIATDRVKRLDADIEKLSGLISDRRQFDAGEQLKDAQEAMANASEPLKPLWKNNVVKRATQWIELADAITQATQQRDQASTDLENWRKDFEKTKTRAEKGASGAIGQLLLRKKSLIPNVVPLRKELDARDQEIRETQSQLYELEDRRNELADPESKAGATFEQLSRKYSDLPDDTEQDLLEMYTIESRVLEILINDTNRYFNLLIATNEDQGDLISELEEYSEFIDERVFWIRSANPPSSADLSQALEAVAWLVDPASWQAALQTLISNLRGDPIRLFLGAVVIGVLFYFRGRSRRNIKALGAIATPRTCRTFSPTLKTLWLTVVVAAGWPLLVVLLGWALRGSGNELVRATSETFSIIAWPLFGLEFAAQVCRSKGLAEAHLVWPTKTVAMLKANLRLLLFAGLPLMIVCQVTKLQSDQDFSNSLGRFCYVVFMGLVSLVCYRIFRSKAGVMESVLSENPDGWLSRLQLVWRIALITAPLVLGVLAVAGFYYTAWRLTSYLLLTVVLVCALVLVGALLYRWVRVKRRQLRWQQAMEHRERLANAEGSEGSLSTVAEIIVEEDEVNLASIDQKTRRLVRGFLFFAGLIGMWLIWANVFPLLSRLEQYGLWDIYDATGGIVSITYADILMAILIVGVTVASAKNVPGLVDILLLERLRIESSIRYAIGALSQYLIVLVGIIVTFGTLGFSWDKVQWLVAALSVGLGFGLQEVVANFICGIILLFERPIRVGDVVTLGDTTGVVTKISIRATRVRNWDRQELVIPNKELITGRIVNWTLTDKLNRIVITVGVAYGSDTRRTRELVFEILREQPNILEDPTPLVTFEQFGDSTLNFVIRAYLASMDYRLETIHELHTIIHERFKKEGIEIAFPQRDLHVRSIDQAVEFSPSGGEQPAQQLQRDGNGSKSSKN